MTGAVTGAPVLAIEGGQGLDRLYPWLDAAAAALGVPAAMLPGMHVALEEAVMNAVMHAFAPDPPGRVTAALHVAPDAALLVVEDGGHAVDPTALAPRASGAEDGAPGGFGLALLRHFCRDMQYARIDGRNRLTLRFPRP